MPYRSLILLGLFVFCLHILCAPISYAQTHSTKKAASTSTENAKTKRKQFFTSRAEHQKQNRELSSLARAKVGGTALDKAMPDGKAYGKSDKPTPIGGETLVSNNKAGDVGVPGRIGPGYIPEGSTPQPPNAQPGIAPPPRPAIPELCLEIFDLIKQLLDKDKKEAEEAEQEQKKEEQKPEKPQEPEWICDGNTCQRNPNYQPSQTQTTGQSTTPGSSTAPPGG
jgi:hypothetical protein